VDQDKCIDCGQCWIYCPDNSVVFREGHMSGFKLTHCKGCGICSKVCPKEAIVMKEE
jgi:pyruvate ferredoxin oxidoreductase delta subunit